MSPYPLLSQQPIKVPRFCEGNGFYTTKKRSKALSKVKAKDTKPEQILRKALYAYGLRFRLHSKTLPGTPDIVIKKYKLAVFVDGSFWHGRNWASKKKQLKSNQAFWVAKIERNMQRDQEVNQALEALGYRVFRFWDTDCQKQLGQVLMELFHYLEEQGWESQMPFLED